MEAISQTITIKLLRRCCSDISYLASTIRITSFPTSPISLGVLPDILCEDYRLSLPSILLSESSDAGKASYIRARTHSNSNLFRLSNGYILQLPHVSDMKSEAMAIAVLKAMIILVSKLVTQEVSVRNVTQMAEHRSILGNGDKT